jgi:Flp pilus assembly protein TadD
MRKQAKSERIAKPDSRLSTSPTQTPGRTGNFAVSTSKNNLLIAGVLLCILAFTAYANTMGNGFAWDDHQQVVMNPSLRPGAPWLRLAGANIWGFTRGGVEERSNYYRPLQMVTYRLTSEIFGFDARAFHAVNLALHLITVLLVFALFYKWIGRIGRAFAAAALFAVHPIHTEAVDWIAALPDIGCTVCFLLAFLFFVLARGETSTPPPAETTRRLYILCAATSYAAFAAALLWKEAAIVFPVIVMAYVFCLGEPAAQISRIGSALKRSLPYWLILGLYFVMRFRVLGFLVTSQRNWILSRLEFGLTVVNLISAYCWKLLAPIHLNAYYVFVPVRTIQEPRAIASILFLLLAAGAIVYGWRCAPWVAFAALWIFITLIPVLNVYAVGRNVFAERYLYLPSVGFCSLIVLVAERIARALPAGFRTSASTVVLAAVLLVFTGLTFVRNPVWKDDSTLFTRTLESSPNAPFVQDMVAAVQPNDALGQQLAASHYLLAISLAESEAPPNRLEMVIAGEGLASIYAARGEFEEAVRTLAMVRTADPGDPQVDGEEGLILMQANRWTEAETALRRAVAITPNDPNVLNALGLLAWQHAGHLEEGAAYFSRALGIHTEADDFNASLHNNLGAIYGQQGRLADAIAEFMVAVRITPNDPEYLTNLGTGYAAVGRTGDARKALQAALAAAPDYAPARAALAQIKAN